MSLHAPRSLAMLVWLWHLALSSLVAVMAGTVTRVHVSGSITMHATNPAVLQLPTAISALKGAIAAGQHASVNAGMVEVSILFAAGRRLAAESINLDRRLITATPVLLEYRIIMPPSASAFNATKVAQEIVQKIAMAPIQMVFEIQKAIKDSSIATMVANLLVSPPIVDTIRPDACVFKYWRFFPVKARGPHGMGRAGAALGELTLYDAGMKQINVTEAIIAGSCQPPLLEGAKCAFDADPATSWHIPDLRPLQFDFKMAQGIDFYRWKTGSVAPTKDPLRWRLEASADNLIWKVVDERALVDHKTPSARRMAAGLFKVGCQGAAPLVAAAGGNDGTGGMSPMLLIVLVLICLAVVAIFVGCLLGGCPICKRPATTKASQVVPVEQEDTGDGPDPFASKLGGNETQVTSQYVWTQVGIDVLQETGHFDVYGQPTLGSVIPENCGDSMIVGYVESGYIEKVVKADRVSPRVLDDDEAQSLLAIKPRQEEYEIIVDKEEGAKLALHFSNFYDDGVSLLIDGIRPGLIESWNDLHPEVSAKVGDRIVDVNGVRGNLEMMREECMKDGVLRMRLVRPGYERVDGIFSRGAKVVINGLSEKTENNGALAEVLRYDQDLQKYLVRLEDSRRKVRLGSANIILAFSDDKGPSPDGHGPLALANS